MAFGEYISGDAEQKYVSMERQREAWELQNDPEGEMKEMVDLYVEKGFKKEDAENVIRTMAKWVPMCEKCQNCMSNAEICAGTGNSLLTT